MHLKNNANCPSKHKWPIIAKRSDAQRLDGTMELCPKCNSITIERRDEHHGISFCEQCGLVTKRIARHYDENGNYQEFSYNQDSFNQFDCSYDSVDLTEENIDILVNEDDLKREIEKGKFKRIEFLQKRYDRKNEGDMKAWRLEQYKNYIGIVNTHFNMNDGQKRRVFEFIRKLGDLKKVHRQRSYEQIVTSLCIQCLKHDGNNNIDLAFPDKKLTNNQKGFLEEIELTETIYFRIIEKAFKM